VLVAAGACAIVPAARRAARDAIASAIALGRQRVTGLPPGGDGLDAIADEIRMDGWRRSAVRWLLAHDRDRILTFFSLTDLLYLGKPAPVALDAWGMAAVADDGCLCTRLPVAGRWHVEIGRVRGGVMATHVADLNLRVAVALHDLKLPGALAKGVLAAATQDYIDRIKTLRADDWITFVRVAQAVSTERIEDYVAGLTSDGPLVPETASAVQPIPR